MAVSGIHMETLRTKDSMVLRLLTATTTLALISLIGCVPPNSNGSAGGSNQSSQYCMADIGPDAAGAKVKEVFGMLSPTALKIVSITPMGGLYKVTFEIEGKEKVVHHTSRKTVLLCEAMSDISRAAELKTIKSDLFENTVKPINSRRKTVQLQIFAGSGLIIDCAASEENRANGVTRCLLLIQRNNGWRQGQSLV